MEQVLDSLHTRSAWRSPVRFEIGRHDKEVMLYCRVRRRLEQSVVQQLQASYPDCRIVRLPDDALRPPAGFRCHRWRLSVRPSTAALRTWHDFADREQQTFADPLAGILQLIDDEALHVRVCLNTRPIRWWNRRLAALVSPQPEPESGKRDRNVFSAWLSIHVAASPRRRIPARNRLCDLAAAYARFAGGAVSFRRSLLPRTFYVSTPELATLWHPATRQVRSEKMATVQSRQFEPPAAVTTGGKEQGIAVLGRTAFRDHNTVCGIRPVDRLRHLYVVGKTGMGKTTLLERQAQSDIEAGHGVMYLDPHGDSAEKLAAAVPTRRTNDVIYFDPSDRHQPIGFNILDCPRADDRPRLASEVVSLLQHIYGIDPSSAPRLLDITRNALLALMEVRGTTLLSLVRMLGDRHFRESIVTQVSDPLVRHYWLEEFAAWKVSEQTVAVASVQNKLRPFIMDYRLRSILGQERNRIDLREIMDEGKVLVVNLSKGRLGEDTSRLIGSLLVTKLQLAAMSRADIPEEKRRPFFAYADEFQNFATASFAGILSEARKYGLSLTVANQFLAQLEQRNRDVGRMIREAVFGNVGSIVAFQVGPEDAATLAEQFGGGVSAEDLMALPKYMAYVRLLIDGMPSRPFTIQTLEPDADGKESRLAVVRRVTRHRYGQPADRVEEQIARAFAA